MKPFNLEEYHADSSMKVVTRDGRNVKIHCTNYYTKYPIIAEIEGLGHSDSFYPDGKFRIAGNSRNNLFFAEEKKEGWMGIFRGNYGPYPGKIFTSKEEAEESSRIYSSFTDDLYLGIVKIEWKE